MARLYKDEFTGYTLAKFQQDLLADLGLIRGGEENFFWSSDQAIVEAERRG